MGSSANKWNAIYAQNGVLQTSDARLKTCIAISDLGKDFVLSLHPLEFSWRNETDRHLGLGVQDILNLVGQKECFGICRDSESMGLNYMELLAPIIRTIQEQRLELLKLKQESNG